MDPFEARSREIQAAAEARIAEDIKRTKQREKERKREDLFDNIMLGVLYTMGGIAVLMLLVGISMAIYTGTSGSGGYE